ncbi:MAG: DUF3373 domain-containing protein [Rhodoferax sp.]
MQCRFQRHGIAAAVCTLLLPLAAYASEADLLQRIEALAAQNALLAQELANLRQQVQQVAKPAPAAQPAETAETAKAVETLQGEVKQLQAKSLGKWLSVSGDYRFRVDSLDGQTKPFVDVNGTFTNAQQALQADFFANPTGASTYFGGMGMSTANALSGLMGFAQGMNAVGTFDQANAFLANPQNAAMAGAMSAFAKAVPAYTPKNSSQFTNRFDLNLGVKATQDVSVTARLAMYKIFGSQSEASLTNAGGAPFFADRVGVFDGTLSHVPSTSYLNVDRIYATWSNIADQELWFSVGRRPSTEGAPSNLRLNNPRPGNGGTPSLLVDYAFDGMTVGWAPEIESLPGFYAKLCYGRGFESGFSRANANSLEDTDMIGISVVPIDTDPLRVWLQWNRGMNIFDAPTMSNTYFGNTQARTNLGDIDWLGVGFMSTFKNVGSGKLHLFGDVAMSRTNPNNNVSAQFGFQGLMTGGFLRPEAPTSKTGTAYALGARYDFNGERDKVGFEFNHGSKNWITFAPAADDPWTAKAGTRGNVVEAYYIHELDKKPVSSFFSKAFFKLGVQRYSFDYTGSNNWVGAPVAIGDLNGTQMLTTTPLDSATNLYATFEVKF